MSESKNPDIFLKNEISNSIIMQNNEFHYSFVAFIMQPKAIRFIGKVSEIPSHFNPKRCGGILVGNDSAGNLVFGFGLDEKTRELTDFSGRLKEKETIIQCALREISEETLGIIRLIPSKVQNNLCICDNDNLTIFIHVQICVTAFSKEYTRRARKFVSKNTYYPEIFSTVWIPVKSMFSLLTDPRKCRQWYTRTKNFILSFPYESLFFPHLFHHFRHI